MNTNKFGMVIEGGVPVYHPEYEDFRDFKKFVEQIEPMGMQTGIVKIVPPKEWLDQLPKLDSTITSKIKIKRPIVQNVSGSHGVFRFQNVEKGRTYSIEGWRKVCNDPSYQLPARRGELRKDKSLPEDITEFDDGQFTDERCEELEKSFWRSIGFSAPMYGADMPGSLFTDDVKEWNVANLESVLSNLDVKIPGVNTAYLYCGMWKAAFPWHLEDMDLHSINYIHFGAPKQWYSISQCDRPRFFKVMKSIFPREFRGCPEFLRHKTFMVSPVILEEHGVKVNKIVHRQHEFIITWAYGYHAGYNYGYNVAESVNFATPSWLDIGVKSDKCHCIEDSVGIDVKRLIRQINGEPLSPPLSPEQFDDVSNEITEVKLQHKLKKRSKPSVQTAPKRPKILRKGNCVLCPHNWDHIYIQNKAKTASVHTICGQLIPETKVTDGTVEDLDTVPPERFKLKCLECKIPVGACVQCSFGKCVRAYHATCLHSAGASVDNGQVYCRYHSREAPEDPSYASSLLVGDLVQCKTPRGLSFAGAVEENLLGEETLVLSALPDREIRIEVTYDQVITKKLDPESRPPEVTMITRPELYSTTNADGETVSPFVFIGVPLPDCLKRTSTF